MNRRQLYLYRIVVAIACVFVSLKEKSAVVLDEESAKRATCGFCPELFECRHSDGLKQQVVSSHDLQLPHQLA